MSNIDKDIDDLIIEVLDVEDCEFLGCYVLQFGFFCQVLGIFFGLMGWVMVVVMFMVLVFVVLVVWIMLQLIVMDDVLMILCWGLGFVVVIQIVLFLCGVLFQQILINQVL